MLDICIDVSDSQPVISWKAVYAAGIRLAFVKAIEGVALGYSTWVPQSIGAREAGIMVVPYGFLRPTTVPPIVAANFIKGAGIQHMSPFALDWEGRAATTCTAAQAETIGNQIAVVAGRKPLGYWGMPGSTPSTPTAGMSGWDRWVPRYPQLPQPAKFADLRPLNALKRPPGLFWQYTSSGKVDGIPRLVDRSVWCGTMDELVAWYATGARPIP